MLLFEVSKVEIMRRLGWLKLSVSFPPFIDFLVKVTLMAFRAFRNLQHEYQKFSHLWTLKEKVHAVCVLSVVRIIKKILQYYNNMVKCNCNSFQICHFFSITLLSAYRLFAWWALSVPFSVKQRQVYVKVLWIFW